MHIVIGIYKPRAKVYGQMKNRHFSTSTAIYGQEKNLWFYKFMVLKKFMGQEKNFFLSMHLL